MTIKLTKDDLKLLLEARLKKLELEIEDIGNSHFIATEMLKESIYEADERKQEYYTKMRDLLFDKLKETADKVDKTAYVYKCMF